MKESPNTSVEQLQAELSRNERERFLAEREEIAETSLANASVLLSEYGLSEAEVARRVAAFKSDITRFFQYQDANFNNAIAINFDESRKEFEGFVNRRLEYILDLHYERSAVHDRAAEHHVMPQNDEASAANAVAPENELAAQESNGSDGILPELTAKRAEVVKSLNNNLRIALDGCELSQDEQAQWMAEFNNAIDEFFAREDASLINTTELDINAIMRNESAQLVNINYQYIERIINPNAVVVENEGVENHALPQNDSAVAEVAEQELNKFNAEILQHRNKMMQKLYNNTVERLSMRSWLEQAIERYWERFQHEINNYFREEDARLLQNANEYDARSVINTEFAHIRALNDDRIREAERTNAARRRASENESDAAKNNAAASDDGFATKLARSREKLLNGIKRSNDDELKARRCSEDQLDLTDLYRQINAYLFERDAQLRLNPNERDIDAVRQLESEDIASFNSAYMDAVFSGGVRPTLCKDESAISKKKAAAVAPEENMNATQERQFYTQLNEAREKIIERIMTSFWQEICSPKYKWDDKSNVKSVEALRSQIEQVIRNSDRQLQQDGNGGRSIEEIIEKESQLIEALFNQAVQQNANDWNERIQHKQQITKLRTDFFISLKEELLKQLAEAPQERLLERLQQIDNEFIAQDRHQPTYILDRIYTDNSRATEIRKAYTLAFLKEELSAQIDQLLEGQRNLFLSQQELFWQMIEMIDAHLSNQGELDYNQMRASYAHVYHQFMSYNNAYTHFNRFVSDANQGIESAELDAMMNYFHSFATDNLFANGEVTETNMASFRHGLWNVGLLFVAEPTLRAYVVEARVEVILCAEDEMRAEISTIPNDRNAFFWYRLRFEENNLINQNAVRDLDDFLSYYSNEYGFASAYRVLFQQVLIAVRDDTDELTSTLLTYNQAYNNLLLSFSTLEGELQNDRNDLVDEHMINLIIFGGIADPTVEFFSDYLLFVYGHQPLTEQVIAALSSYPNALDTALLQYNEAYNNFLHLLNNLGEEDSQHYRNQGFNVNLIDIIMSGNVATPTVEFFSDYLLFVYGRHFYDMANDEQSADREQANVTYQTFLHYFIGAGDVAEYEAFWSYLNQLTTISEVHQAIQQRILANMPRNNLVELENMSDFDADEELGNAAEPEEVPDVTEERRGLVDADEALGHVAESEEVLHEDEEQEHVVAPGVVPDADVEPAEVNYEVNIGHLAINVMTGIVGAAAIGSSSPSSHDC